MTATKDRTESVSPSSEATEALGETPTETPPVETAPPVDEVAILVPEPNRITLSNGIEVDILPLKARQFFALLRILTRGAAGILPRLATITNPEELVGQLTALVLFAVPEAPDATFEFLTSVIEIPTVPQARGRAAIFSPEGEEVVALMANPEMDDVMAILEVVVRTNADDLASLGKRMMAMISLARKTGQIKE